MALEAKLVARLDADNQKLIRKLNQTKREMRKFQTTTSKITKSIQTGFASMFAGVAVTQGARYAINTMANFEFQMDKVAAVSGATADEIAALTKNAQDLGARSKFTATEIGKLQEEFSRLGFASKDIINLTDATRQLATVADSELGESAKVVGNVINAFGLETMEAGRIANTMAESFSKSALDLQKFSVAMGNVGANAKAFGLTVEETTAYLGALVDAGIDASKAGTDLRTILIEVNKRGITLSEAFDMIRNSTNKTTTATELFDKRAAAAGIILADNTVKVNNLTSAFSDNRREMSAMTDVMEDNLLTDFAKLRSALDGLVLQEGSKFNGWIRGATQFMTDFVTAASMDRWTPQAWNELQKEIEETTDSYKLLAEAITKGAQPGVVPAASAGIVIPKTSPKGRLDSIEAGASNAGLLAGSDALRNIDIGSIEDIEGASQDYDRAFSTLTDGFAINADALEAETSRIAGTLEEFKGVGPTLTEQAMQIYPAAEELQNAGQALATGFASIADNIFSGSQSIGQAILKGFSSMMRSVGFKYIEAGALFFANSMLSQAATGGIPQPHSEMNRKKAIESLGIGLALGASGGILNRMSNSAGGFGGSGGGFSGDSSGRIGRGGQNVTLDGQFRIQGSDLVYVLDRERNITGRTG
jgi:hypothetical protein